MHLSCPGLASSGWSGRRASRGCHCGEPAAQPAKPCGLAVAAEEKEEEEDDRNSPYIRGKHIRGKHIYTCTSEVSTYIVYTMYVYTSEGSTYNICTSV